MEVLGQELREYIIKSKQFLYGLKQESYIFFGKMQTALCAQGFSSLNVDPCVFISNKITLLVYINNCILFLHEGREDDIDELVKLLWEDFELTNDRLLENFLGIYFDWR